MKRGLKKPKKFKGYDCYPWWIVFLTNLASLSVYIAGAVLMYFISPYLAIIYVAFMLYLETKIYRERCVNCYYYGKLCAFGRGKIAKAILKKGHVKNFCDKKVSFKDFILPSLANIIPVIAGVYLLITDFRWWVLLVTLWPALMLFVGNPIIFGKYACNHCRQAEIFCPACEFFNRKNK